MDLREIDRDVVN